MHDDSGKHTSSFGFATNSKVSLNSAKVAQALSLKVQNSVAIPFKTTVHLNGGHMHSQSFQSTNDQRMYSRRISDMERTLERIPGLRVFSTILDFLTSFPHCLEHVSAEDGKMCHKN
jgi:hypothetical protein